MHVVSKTFACVAAEAGQVASECTGTADVGKKEREREQGKSEYKSGCRIAMRLEYSRTRIGAFIFFSLSLSLPLSVVYVFACS